MSKSPLYIYMDEMVVEVHKEGAYHQTSDGKHFVELGEPVVSISRDDTIETLPELFARLGEWQAIAYGIPVSPLQPALFPLPPSETDPR